MIMSEQPEIVFGCLVFFHSQFELEEKIGVLNVKI